MFEQNSSNRKLLLLLLLLSLLSLLSLLLLLLLRNAFASSVDGALLERLAWRNPAGGSTVMCLSESVVGSSVDGPGPSEAPS